MKVVIEPYNGNWKAAFDKELQNISSALQDLNPAIEHIGSTAIKDIWAKPIIDILVGVERESDLDDIIEPMIEAGYTYVKKVEPLMPYRRFFVKLTGANNQIIHAGDERRFGEELQSLVNIHILEKDTEHWIRHIAFRDYIKVHHEVRQQYAKLKKEIVKVDLSDHMEYNSYKDEFIKKVEKDALAWYRLKIKNPPKNSFHGGF